VVRKASKSRSFPIQKRREEEEEEEWRRQLEKELER